MANQSATNVLAALKREGTFGTAAGASSGRRLRILDTQGLEYGRTPVESQERRSDQLENIGRLGSKSVAGPMATELNPGGDFDWLAEDILRGTIGGVASVAAISTGTRVAKIDTPAAPVYRSYTIEQRDIDIDRSELFRGCRLTQGEFSFQPNETSKATWTFMGVDRDILATGSSPYYTTPTLTSGIPLIADDAVISYDGSVVTTFTGIDLSIAVDAAGQPVLGSLVSPDIWMNKLRVGGTISAIRQDLAALTQFDTEDEFELKLVLAAPGSAPKLTFGIILPRVKLYGISAPFSGGDAAKVEQRTFRAHPPAGASNVVEFYTSTETPVAV